MRRVLKPALLPFQRMGSHRREFAAAVTDAVTALFPADPPRFLARTPHGFHDITPTIQALGAAGFARGEAEMVAKLSRAPSARDVAIGFCEGTPLRSEIEARDPERLGEATEAAATALAGRFGTGPIEGKIQAHIFTAHR